MKTKSGKQPKRILGTRVRQPNSNLKMKRTPFRQALRDINGQSIQQLMDDRKVPGLAIGLIENNEVVDEVAYGVQNTDTQEAVKTNTLFQCASVSKFVNAIVMLKLVDMGCLSLDEDICQKIGWSPDRREGVPAEPVTLRELLRHSAGIKGRGTTTLLEDGSGFVPRVGGNFNGYQSTFTGPMATVNGIANSDDLKTYAANTCISYSGSGTIVTQHALEEITGTTYARWTTVNIFKKLGLLKTTFNVGPPGISMYGGGAASGHTDFTPIPGLRNTYPQTAAAGLYSTVENLGRLLVLVNQCGRLDGERVIARNLMEQMFNNYEVGGDSSMLGCFRLGNNGGYVHTGNNLGFRCAVFGYPQDKAGLVVLTNSDDTFIDNDDNERFVYWDIHNAVKAACGWT